MSTPDGGAIATYPARLVNQEGLYRAAVVFPSRGRFEYVIDDGTYGVIHRHTFPLVSVGGDGAEAAATPVPAGEDGDPLLLALALAAGAGFLTAWIVLLLVSRRTVRGEPALEDEEPARPRAPGRGRSDGRDRDVAIVMAVDGGDDEREAADQAQATTAPGAVRHARGRALFFEMGCGSCHELAATGSTGAMGAQPRPAAGGPRPRLAQRRDPEPAGSERRTFSLMPDNFDRHMTDDELDDWWIPAGNANRSRALDRPRPPNRQWRSGRVKSGSDGTRTRDLRRDSRAPGCRFP